MRKAVAVSFTVLFCLCFTTGCWDRMELNELAIILGWGMDITKDGTHLATAEIAIPSKLGGAQSSSSGGGAGGGKGYFVERATGENVLDAAQNMQAKVSRTWFASHRRVGLIGENLARRGVRDVLDTWTRDPMIRLRTDMFVVKGAQASDVFLAPSPLENVPALGVLKEHKVVGGIGDVMFLNFLIAAQAKGDSPTLPALAVDRSPQGRVTGVRLTGTAVFNQGMQLVGFLPMKDAYMHQWVAGRLKNFTLTVSLSPKSERSFSYVMEKLGSDIQPVMHGRQMEFKVLLTGTGSIKENDTQLDLSRKQNLEHLQAVLNRQAANDALQTITKVQKLYGADIFGFGDAVHRRYPKQWKTLKENWDPAFRAAKVSVQTNLAIQRTGLTKAPLQLNEDLIQK